MDNTGITSISDSLLNRQVYCVCYTELDGSDSFHNELYQLRKDFFTENIHKLSRRCEYSGYEGWVKGKIRRHSLKWRKNINHTLVQEAFLVNGAFVVVIRDLNGSITGKLHFDKNLLWIKSEYFSADDYSCATTILKPVETMDAIEMFSYSPEKKNYSSVILYPVPYMYGAAEQSVINAKHGDNLVLVATDRGEFCYCCQQESVDRMRSIEEIKSGTIMLLPAWEVKEGEVPETAKNETVENTPVFTDLFEPAHTETAEKTVEAVTAAKIDENAGTIDGQDLTLEVEKTEIKRTVITSATETYNYTGVLIEGKREGRGRTDQPNGLTAFDGEYMDNKKQGFGSSYYQNGSLSYVGGWREDKKDGVGISFREKDHAIHVCKWVDGEPESFTTLFDSEGNLRYSGKITDGKKSGVGVSYRKSDDTVFVGKWVGGQASGGSIFDADGNLIYTGGWSDGKRNGTGTEFDVNGQIIYSGEWKDDKYLNGILYQKI